MITKARGLRSKGAGCAHCGDSESIPGKGGCLYKCPRNLKKKKNKINTGQVIQVLTGLSKKFESIKIYSQEKGKAMKGFKNYVN